MKTTRLDRHREAERRQREEGVAELARRCAEPHRPPAFTFVELSGPCAACAAPLTAATAIHWREWTLCSIACLTLTQQAIQSLAQEP